MNISNSHLINKSIIKVLVIDDSALIRSLLTEIINANEDMCVVATAADPIIARELIKLHKPDVLTLDVEMPRMDGLDFLERLMRFRPMPVVMVSTWTELGSEITLRALELGAVDFVTKPKISLTEGIEAYAEIIADKIRAAAQANIASIKTHHLKHKLAKVVPNTLKPSQISSERLIVIGASTGGTEAIKSFLMQMPSGCPGILIAQHMPAGFTKSFANRLNSICNISVKEAAGGERILPGHAYIAPGDKHLSLSKSGAHYVTVLDDSPPVNRHKPSVDILFGSAANYAGKNAVGLILTGMGKDGALGMKQMKGAGAYNFAQNEESCVVFGMPREAIVLGGVDEVVHLEDLPGRILHFLVADSGRSISVWK